MRAMGVADEVLGLFIAQGSNSYAEQVTMEEHARQAAALAQAEGASDAWVLAALLHDIGHFLEEPDSEFGVTDHGTSGGMWLAERFVEEVSEPVRLHVAAKRYRCFVDPDYQSRLSSASVGTLRLQGGPMSADEAEIFEAERVDRVIDVEQADAEATMKRLAKEEGIFAGPSSGGSVFAALSLAQEVENATIAMIICDRGDRYLSTGVYDKP